MPDLPPLSSLDPPLVPEVNALVEALRRLPGMSDAVGRAQSWYSCLPFCILAAVFSINSRYSVVHRLLERYRDRYGLPPIELVALPRGAHEPTVSELISHIQALGADRFASQVLLNRMRTSTRGGILKAQAGLDFAQVLAAHGVERKDDARRLLPNPSALADLVRDLKHVHGQASGISVDYFLMNVGDPTRVKADRWVLRFLGASVARDVHPTEARPLLLAASQRLGSDYPGITPRALDRLIWAHQTQWDAFHGSHVTEADRLRAEIARTEERLGRLRDRLTKLVGSD